MLVGQVADLHEDKEHHRHEEQEGRKYGEALAVLGICPQVGFRVCWREFGIGVGRGSRGVLRRGHRRGLGMAHCIVDGTAHDERKRR